MAFQNEDQMDDRAGDRLFPWRDAASLPLPRFGKVGPSVAKALPQRVNDAAPIQSGFALKWDDPALGLSIEVLSESGPDGDELWAYVDSTHPAGRGFGASVFLVGKVSGRAIRRTVKLDRPLGGGSHGKVRFGTIAEVQGQIDGDVELGAFLVEPAQTGPA